MVWLGQGSYALEGFDGEIEREWNESRSCGVEAGMLGTIYFLLDVPEEEGWLEKRRRRGKFWT